MKKELNLGVSLCRQVLLTLSCHVISGKKKKASEGTCFKAKFSDVWMPIYLCKNWAYCWDGHLVRSIPGGTSNNHKRTEISKNLRQSVYLQVLENARRQLHCSHKQGIWRGEIQGVTFPWAFVPNSQLALSAFAGATVGCPNPHRSPL